MLVVDTEEDEVINCAKDPRVGLQLTRYHSWPRIREQSVGEHSAQVMRILLTVWPDAPRHLLVYALYHDIGEMAGDVQYPFKSQDPLLKVRMDEAERQVTTGMNEEFPNSIPNVLLSPFERAVFKLCEYVEMWEWGLHEMNLGNQYGRTVSMRMSTAKSAQYEAILSGEVPAEEDERDAWPALASNIKRYIERRLTWEKQ